MSQHPGTLLAENVPDVLRIMAEGEECIVPDFVIFQGKINKIPAMHTGIVTKQQYVTM